MGIPDDDKQLRRSLRLLDPVLTRVLKTRARPGVAEVVEQLQRHCGGNAEYRLTRLGYSANIV